MVLKLRNVHSPGSMTVEETLGLIENLEFPLKLRFRRLHRSSSLTKENDKSSPPKLSLSSSSIDVRGCSIFRTKVCLVLRERS